MHHDKWNKTENKIKRHKTENKIKRHPLICVCTVPIPQPHLITSSSCMIILTTTTTTTTTMKMISALIGCAAAAAAVSAGTIDQCETSRKRTAVTFESSSSSFSATAPVHHYHPIIQTITVRTAIIIKGFCKRQ